MFSDDELSIGSEHVSLEDVTNHYRPEDDYDSDPEPRAYHDMPPQIGLVLLPTLFCVLSHYKPFTYSFVRPKEM